MNGENEQKYEYEEQKKEEITNGIKENMTDDGFVNIEKVSSEKNKELKHDREKVKEEKVKEPSNNKKKNGKNGKNKEDCLIY